MNLLTEEEIFAAAIQKPSAERAAFLDRACAGDAALRAQVEALLLAYDQPDSLLDVPTGNVTIDSPSRQSEVLGTRIGPYKLLQQLGEGGMGTVYLAEQQQPVKRQVALKIIKAGMDSAQVIARFEQERQALAIMDHPHIAKVLDAGTTESGRPYFVMELVKGIPITRYCDQEHLSPKERLELFIPVCQAVQHAHQKGVIHRDLKPSNVMIALYDGQPVPKVIDFGVAKATSQKLTERTLFTEVGSIVGTLEYMAPEQAELNNLDIDTRADIYSLGVLLYEMLAGAPPFSAQQLRSASFNEMLRIIKEVEPQKPSTKLSASVELPSIAANRKLEPNRLTRLVRGDLDWIVMKCLEKERARRYETANAFALDIKRYLDDEPVIAGRPSTAYRLKKFLWRNRPSVVAAAIVLLTLVTGIVGTTWGLIRAEKARQREAARAEAETQQRRRAEAAETAAKNNEQLATAERDRAEQEKRVAQAVKDFLQKRLLNQADAENQADALLQAGGSSAEIKENPTIRDLLDRAAAELTTEKIERQFPKLPLVQAEILRTIGDTYGGLGELGPAIAHLERARDLYVAHLGPDHPGTLATLDRLAWMYGNGEKLPQAVQLFEQVRDRRIATFGLDDPGTLTTLHELAWTYQSAGRLPEALQLFEQVRDRRIATLGSNHPDTLRTIIGLAYTQFMAKKLPEAIQLFEQVRDQQIAKLGRFHPDTMSTAVRLATAYRGAGKLPEAIQLFEEVRDQQIAKLGPDHPNTLSTMFNLAVAYRTAGKLPEAIQLFELVLEKQTTKLGPDHPFTLNSLNALASAYRAAGKLKESVPFLERLRAQQIAKLGPDHQATLTTQHSLALAYRSTGRLQEAIPILEHVRDQQMAKLGSAHSSTVATLHNLGDSYQLAGRYSEAIPLFEQVRDQQIAKLGPDNPTTLSTLVDLAVTLRQAGKLPEALQIWDEMMPRARRALGPTLAIIVTYNHNWCIALDAAHQFGKAAEIRRESVAIERQRVPAEAPRLASALGLLGQSLLSAEQFTEAEHCLRECLTLCEKAQPDSWLTFHTKTLLGGALTGQKNYADAEQLLLSGYVGMKQREAQIPESLRATRLTEALQRLIDLYTAWDKPDQAAKWCKILNEYKSAETRAAGETEER